MDDMPYTKPYLRRTLNEHQWSLGEEEYQKTGKQPLLVEKSADGFEFWIVEYAGQVMRKTVYGNDVTYDFSRAKMWKQS